MTVKTCASEPKTAPVEERENLLPAAATVAREAVGYSAAVTDHHHPMPCLCDETAAGRICSSHPSTPLQSESMNNVSTSLSHGISRQDLCNESIVSASWLWRLRNALSLSRLPMGENGEGAQLDERGNSERGARAVADT